MRIALRSALLYVILKNVFRIIATWYKCVFQNCEMTLNRLICFQNDMSLQVLAKLIVYEKFKALRVKRSFVLSFTGERNKSRCEFIV